MDINSLLSPSDTPTSGTPPPAQSSNTSSPALNPVRSPNRQQRPVKLNKRNSSALSQQLHYTSSPLHSPTDPILTPLSHRDPHAQAAYPLSSPSVTSAPGTNGRLGSAGGTPPLGERGSLPPIRRQGSTPGMDTLADLASLQHPQPAHPSARNQPLHLQNLSRSLSAQSSAKDIVMADRSPKLPRTFTSSETVSAEDASTLSQLSKQLHDKPLDYSAHLQYISLLKQGLTKSLDKGDHIGDYDFGEDLREARKNMDKNYTLGEELWLDWLNDEAALAQSTDDRFYLMDLYSKCIDEEPSSDRIWRSYGDYMYSLWASSNEIPESQIWSEEDRLVGKEVFTWDSMMKIWTEGIAATQWHISGSELVWDRYIEILLLHQPSHPNLENIFATRLMKPHITWDATFSKYSQFISSNYSDSYETIMHTATTTADQAKTQFSLREPFEHKIQLAQQHGDKDAEWEALKSYLDWELEYKGVFSFDLINGLFERATTRFSTDSSLWEDYVEFLIENPAQSVSVLSVVERATRHCPWSGDLWSHRLLTLEAEKKSFEELEKVKHKATESGMLDHGGMEELLKVYVSWCGFLRRKAFESRTATEEDIDVAEVGIRSALEHVKAIGQKKYGSGFQGDPMYRLERIHIKFYTQYGNTNAARDLWEGLIPQQQGSYDFWYRYYIWEMVIWSKFSTNDNAGTQLRTPYEATALLRKALKLHKTMDWPEQLVAMFLNHCEQHESVQELRTAIIESRRVNIDIAKRRQREAAAPAAHEQAQQASQAHHNDVHMEESHATGKRKRDIEGAAENGQIAKKTKADIEEAEPVHQSTDTDLPTTTSKPTIPISEVGKKRDRENTTIVVRQLHTDATETEVRKFFSSAGTVLSVKIIRESDSQTAIVEFESKNEAEYAQTYSGRPFMKKPIEINIATETTLWVTSYPKEADEKYIRKLFEPYGEVLSVRFPSLKFDAKRRFCYVQFAVSEEAHDATALDGHYIDDKHTLVAKISNPSLKIERVKGPAVYGLEVLFRNVSFDATDSQFKKLAETYTELDHFHVLRNYAGKSKGMAFAVYYSREDANLAVAELNGSMWKGRQLAVEISDPNYKNKNMSQTVSLGTTTTEPAGGKEKQGFIYNAMNYKARTMYLLNVPDTVNDARVRSVAEKYGPTTKIIVMHDKAAAIVEFKTIADHGKAELGLEGFEIAPGYRLKLGTSHDLKERKAILHSDRLDWKTPTHDENGEPIKKPELKPKAIGLAPTRSLLSMAGKRGGRGGRAGLGFRPAKKVSGDETKPDTEGESSKKSTGPGKSQADFRAMLLTGKNKKEDDASMVDA